MIISIHHILFCYGDAGYLNHPLDLGSEDMLADPISYLINHLSVIGVYYNTWLVVDVIIQTKLNDWYLENVCLWL